MLGIGFKVSDTPLPALRRPLQEFIAREYAAEAAEGGTQPAAVSRGSSWLSSSSSSGAVLTPAQQDAVDKFFQLKTDADLVRTPSAISRHVLLRYSAQLERFVTRFPCEASAPSGSGGGGASATRAIASSNGGSPPLRLQFTWNDSFCPRKKITQVGVHFEQAAVMFNYGALESQLGVQTDRSSADGLKAACKHFMLAAGAFARVKDDLVPQCLGARTPDMSAEGLGLLTYLMLAQAQACFYEKSIKDQMKDGIKAKLAHQALEYYTSALGFCNSSALSGTIDRTWSIHVAFQVRCMTAATQYWQAKAAKEVALSRGIGYGEEIARLKAAEDECHHGIKLASTNKLPGSLIESLRALQRVIREHLQVAQKDNSSVYLENVPKFSDLPAIGKANMVKPLLLTSDELAQELSGGDLFEQFVPNNVLQRAAEVKEEVKQLLSATTEKVSESNEASKNKLNMLGLPASIEAFEKTSDNGIPATIWQRIQHIQTSNRIFVRAEVADTEDPQNNTVSAFLQQKLKENQNASDQAEKRLHAIESQLTREEVEDNVCRQNYGKRWTRPASSTLSQIFRADVDRYFRLVQEAKNSDIIVRDKLVSNASKLVLLSQAKAALDRQLPILQQENSSCSEEIDTLSTLLLQLGNLIDEKDQAVKDFNSSYEKLNVLPILLNSTRDAAETESALAGEKQFFSTHFVDKIETICGEEQSLLGQIVDANALFDAKKASDSVIQARQAFLQLLSDAVDVFEQLESHVKEGNKFYDELQARINQLHQTVADHCAAREIEKRELELNIASDDEMKENEAKDAALAQQMMANLQVQDAAASSATLGGDEAYARQLAGSTPQFFSPPRQQQQLQQQQQQQQMPPPPSYDYARVQAQQQNGQTSGGYVHPYAVYQQHNAGGGASAPTAPPPYGGYAPSHPPTQAQFSNFYNQPQHHPQQQQQQQQGGFAGYYQYPGYQQQVYTSGSPPAAYNPNPPNGHSV